ncbi:hypothetical protein KP78_15440 [Jeotgalibacillus soli]|uniref:Uncharacterized protein n=1 Tax=Jeotgalibacillus soli TaxID=889306 RepID=A0A0C2VVL2_9BACL|nr:hypothetical protein KP78_15440 [Jeotgalibacillus soli]
MNKMIVIGSDYDSKIQMANTLLHNAAIHIRSSICALAHSYDQRA